MFLLFFFNFSFFIDILYQQLQKPSLAYEFDLIYFLKAQHTTPSAPKDKVYELNDKE